MHCHSGPASRRSDICGQIVHKEIHDPYQSERVYKFASRFEATTPTLQLCTQQTLEVTIFFFAFWIWSIPKSLRSKDFKILDKNLLGKKFPCACDLLYTAQFFVLFFWIWESEFGPSHLKSCTAHSGGGGGSYGKESPDSISKSMHDVGMGIYLYYIRCQYQIS